MVLFAFVAMSVLGAQPALDLLQKFPGEVFRNEVVEFKTVKDHHFSAEAPQSCGGGRLTARSARSLKCQFSESGQTQAMFNVCDDRKTFCKPVRLGLSVADKGSSNAERLTANENLNESLKREQLPGFESGRPDAIRRQAVSLGKPVFVMIATDWCPPCNEAKEHLLSSSFFEKISSGWFKVYVDGDSLAASDWAEVVPYKFYPSFVMLNSSFEEIGRYSGPLRQAEFVQWAKVMEFDRQDSIDKVKARVLGRLDGGLWRRFLDLITAVSVESRRSDEVRLLKWAIDMQDETLVDRLSGTADRFPEIEVDWTRFQISRFQKSDEAKEKRDKLIELYQRLLTLQIAGDGWVDTLNGFCAFDAKACAPQQVHVERRLTGLEARRGLSPAERASVMGEDYAGLAEFYQVLGKKTEERIMARKCVAAYENLRGFSRLKLSRAAHMGIVGCLESAEEYGRAEEALKSLIAAYPSEPTFLLRMARVQRESGKPASALDWIKKAEGVAYGYNWINSQLIKADVLVEMRRNREALTVVKAAMNEIQLDGASDSRSQRSAARLRAVQAKAEAGLIR